MSFSQDHNIGSKISTPYTAKPTAIVAAGSGDNTAIVGATIDRLTYNNPQSLRLALQASATLAAAATLTVKTVDIFHDDASNMGTEASFAVLENGTGSVIGTGGGGGTTELCNKNYDVDLAGAKRYIRVKFTPDLSAGATDTAGVAAQIIFGGRNVDA